MLTLVTALNKKLSIKSNNVDSLFIFVSLFLGAALYRAHVGGWRRTAGGI